MVMRENETINQVTSSTAVQVPSFQLMKPLMPFAPGRLPEEEIRQFTDNVNVLITQYNASEDIDEKKELLHKIQHNIQTIDHLYPMYMRESQEYHLMRGFLFKEIQAQFTHLGVHSLIRETEQASLLSEVIANMSPEKADAFGAIIIRYGNTPAILGTQLSTLYPEDDTSLESQRYRQLIATHEITFLGGGNSQSYKVRNLEEGSISILKLDGQTATPRNIEDHLRDKIGHRFAPIEAERSVLCTLGQLKSGRSLIVSAYYKNGNIFDYAARNREVQVTQLFEQMAAIMLEIQVADCLFPDAKGGNWLVDDTNKLRLLDAKSFLYTIDGKYNSAIPGNMMGNPRDYIETFGFIPPEYMPVHNKPRPLMVDADKVHAYILGQNIEGCLESAQIPKADAPFLQKLVSDLKAPNKSRISVSQAMIRLFVFNHPEYQAEFNKLPERDATNKIFIHNNPDCKIVFTLLNELKFGKNDKNMENFILEKQQDIKRASPEERIHSLEELNTLVLQLQADPFIVEMKKTIADLRDTQGLFNRGYQSKALRLENAMSDIPIEKRNHAFAAADKAVISALAAQTSFLEQGKTYLTPEGEIDEKKATSAFIDIKKRFNIQIGKDKKDSESELSPLSSTQSKG